MCQRETKNNLEEGIDYKVSALSDEDLISMSIGAYDPKGHLGSIIGSASVSVAGAAGETSKVSERLGLKPLVMADGPAGLRLSIDWYETKNGPIGFVASIPESLNDLIPKAGLWLINKLKKPPVGVEIRHHYATALPIGTAIAQSWNLSFAEQCGNLVGDEMERMGIQLWLAPALNIHRDIRCGRNFEYYSEDPMLSGLFAAAITRGVQSHPGCGVTIKHFAANNQEINRYNSNSVVSERALREIYLRGFGICVREAQPKAIMTSYNLINGIHTSEHPGLLQDILRGEFGFDGIIMTDWVIRAMKNKDSIYPDADAAHVAAVGGELFMPGCKDDAVSMRKAIRSGLLSRQQLEKNVSGLIRKIRAFQT